MLTHTIQCHFPMGSTPVLVYIYIKGGWVMFSYQTIYNLHVEVLIDIVTYDNSVLFHSVLHATAVFLYVQVI